MPTLEALTAGVPNTGLEYLSTALESVFGEGGVAIKELGNDDLRQNVRLSTRADTIVLVVLDSFAKDACKDIENGLYESDKFHKYVDDAELVDYLNKTYGLELQPPEDISMEVAQDILESSAYKAVIDEYQAKISDRDGEIQTLKFHIQELEGYLECGGVATSDEDYEKIQSEVIELRSKLADAEGEISELKQHVESLKENLKAAEIRGSQQKAKFESLQSDYEKISHEFTEEKVNSSKKSAVIKDKNEDIEKLQAELKSLLELKEQVSGFSAEKEGYTKTIEELTKSISDLKIEMANKEAEISRLNDQIRSNATDTRLVMEYKGYLKESEEEKAELEKRVASFDVEIESVRQQLSETIERAESLDLEANRLDALLQDKDNTIVELNTIKLELEGKIRLLEQSTNRNMDLEASLEELTELRKKVADLQTNVFSRIGDSAFPKSAIKVNLIPLVGIHYDNIRFVFAGSTESRKGIYKCLLKEFNNMPQTKFLLVDAVSETYLDYVFQIQKLTPGVNWFTKGGGTQPYLSPTCLQNVKALSMGLNFINDSFLLTVNWAKRLDELNQSGYSVVVVCGDLSSMIGRIMFESFVDLGASTVYAVGNSVGSRTVLSNMRGLSSAKNSTVVYYDFNRKMQPFYDKMLKVCKCHILNNIS